MDYAVQGLKALHEIIDRSSTLNIESDGDYGTIRVGSCNVKVRDHVPHRCCLRQHAAQDAFSITI